MAKGRRPLPTAVKKLRGNPGKRALNPQEPKPSGIAPEMPSDLPELAQIEWNAIVPLLLQLGVLSQIDGKALAAYCHAYARWMQAECEVRRYGIVVKEPVLLMGKPTGYERHKKNPAVTISETAMKIMKSFLIEFGLTPASRSKLHIEQGKPIDPMEAYLDRRTNAQKHVN
jgi:P27 family predicted phage terminase small subunit